MKLVTDEMASQEMVLPMRVIIGLFLPRWRIDFFLICLLYIAVGGLEPIVCKFEVF